MRHANLPLAFAFLRFARSTIADGRHAITGDSVYANVMSYVTKPVADRTHEAHRVYADVQFLLSGEEIIHYTPRERLGSGTGYVSEKDFELFPAPVDPTELVFRAGQIAIFLPGEGHKPGVAWREPAPVRKIVVKVAL
jgi:YhcH/YjgK/YiaL family protein